MKGGSIIRRKRRELFVRHKKNPVLAVKDWPYHANAVFSPAAAIVDGKKLLLMRVEDHRGISHLIIARNSQEWGWNKWPGERTLTNFCPGTRQLS